MRIFQTVMVLVLFLGVLGAGQSAIAQEALSYNRALQAIAQLNQIPPLQDPDLETGKDILSSKIIDSSSRVIGEVKKVVLQDDGSIALMEVEFDRLRVRGKVPVDYRSLGLRRASNGYKTAFEAAQIEDMIPQMLAGIATAAGGDQESYDLESLKNTMVVDDKGKRIGKIDQVLFGTRGAQAQAFLVKLFVRSVGEDTVAIPLQFTDVEVKRGKAAQVVVSKAQARAMYDYVMGSR